jgi:hypothetical protein
MPVVHITHLTHIGLFPYVTTHKTDFPYCYPTLSLEAKELCETHFLIWTGNFYVNLNSPGTGGPRDFFIALQLKHFKNVVFLMWP